MKVAPREADRFAQAPDPAVRAVLVYGPDAGLVRERAAALIRSVVDEPTDPFRVSEPAPAELKDDPARLADEAAALSLTGGRRVVRLREAGDALAVMFRDFLADPPGAALIVVEAGDLPARSALRKVFESAARGAALGCYRDDERSLPKVIDATLHAQGLRATPEARAFLAANLGADRQVTRRELEKLALYKGPAGGQIALEDAQACIGDSAALSLEDLAFAVAGGELAEFARALDRSFQEGAHPVAALRAVARHLQRLHLVAGLVRQGTPIEQAVKSLRPPVFWKRAAGFKSQAGAWQPAALARALDRLIAAETACKQTGAPADSLCGRALLEIASRAPTRPPRRPG